MNEDEHCPVLLAEVLDNLAIKSGGIYVDGTFGRGGHAKAILNKVGPAGKLFALDKDPAAVLSGEKELGRDERFKIQQGSFTQLAQFASQEHISGKIDGILLDLGVSSPQLNNPQRGFSFLHAGPLDMRMDPTHGISVAEWLIDVSEQKLAQIIKEFGEERFARRIAKAIVRERMLAPIDTTERFAKIVADAHPAWEKHKHPATRVFQALRIFINNELDDLTQCLDQCLEVLAVGGRIAVISFHSLEDRIVKRFIRRHVRGDDYPLGVPVTVLQLKPRLRSICNNCRPSEAEVKNNHRARSAVLRVAEKVS